TSAAPAGATPIATFRNGPGTLTRNASIGAAFSGSLVVFTAADATHGLELWQTDGTASGTGMLDNIAPEGPGVQPADLDLHTDTNGTLLTICLENGPPLGIGLIALAAAPSPGIAVPGLIDGKVLITPPIVTDLVLLDGAGTGCITITVPNAFFSIEFVGQGFTADPATFFPLLATDIGSAAVSSVSLVSLFGGTVKTVGTYQDKDHRYEVSVQLPSGVHTPGTFKFRHRIGQGTDSYLKELGEAHHYPYNGETLSPQPFTGVTPTEKISGLELWFVDGEGKETFVWKSYC
ncbi:MAG TPA: hypothetical protein VFZ65_02105, partial [Planctomycetota bacterium]|nr:hypothetical protein [Planctomycetota bacterium]